jgi:PhzF family phenazine biosynthesis protein
VPIPIYHVDAFTAQPFAGNPAAVCLLEAAQDDRWLRNVAREMNLSETAFLLRQQDGFSLRWFTPALEVDLCGHATLASAHVLWEQGLLRSDEPARFHTRSGLLGAVRQGDWIEMDFPAEPLTPLAPTPELAAALGVVPLWVGRNRLDYLLVEVDAETAVRSARPDLGLLRRDGHFGYIVTSRAAGGEFDFVSRFFAPLAGVDEDPVTGSAHSSLGPFWGERLGKGKLVAYQASARGGVVRVRLAGDRVGLGGQAVTVLAGQLL